MERIDQDASKQQLLSEIQILRAQLAQEKKRNQLGTHLFNAMAEGDPAMHSEAEWASMLRLSSDHIILLDPDGTIKYINRTLDGFKQEKVVGHPMWEFLVEPNKEVVKKHFQLAIQTQKVQQYELRYDYPGVPVVWFENALHPVFEDGKIKYLILYSRNITSNKSVDSQLRESESHLRMIYDSASDVISILDREGRFEFINRTIPPTQPQDLWGTTAWDYSPPEMAEKIKQAFYQSLKNQETVSFESQVDSLAGITIWYSNKLHPIVNEEGEVENLVLFSREINDLKATQLTLERVNAELEERVARRTEQLERANEEILHFAYIVSHDLRVPLGNIKGFASEIELSIEDLDAALRPQLERLPDGVVQQVEQIMREELAESLRFIKRATRQMNGLITSVLKLARIGRRPLEITRVDLSEVVDRVKESFSHRLQQMGGTIERGELPDIIGDVGVMEQIFTNLLDNALKYRHPERPLVVEISATRQKRLHFIHVKDNGLGIRKKEFKQIFQIFRRAGQQQEPGEGMGLAYVKSLVGLLEGDIEVESEWGEGSTFVLNFPEIDPQALNLT
jgi:PAS domain S-box-containing protein